MVLRGEEHGKSKLTEHNIRQIRDDPRTYRDIAESYGISVSTVHSIKTGKTWAHVPVEPIHLRIDDENHT